MPNYSFGGFWWFWGFTHSTLKAHIFYTVGRKYFWPVSFKKAWKNLSESHKFCPVSFRNGATVISQSTVKIVFFRCLTNLILLSNFFQGNGDKNRNIKIFGQIMLQVNDNSQKTRSESEFWLKNAKLQLWWLVVILGF